MSGDESRFPDPLALSCGTSFRVARTCLTAASAILDSNEGSLNGAGVIRRRTDQTVVSTLFEYVRGPTGDARENEQRRVERSRNVEESVKDGAVEIEIWKDSLLALHDSFDPFGDSQQPSIFIAGGDDQVSVVEDAFASLDAPTRAFVVHGSGLRTLRAGKVHFAIVAGAPGGRYARDAEACGFVEEDLVEVRAAVRSAGATRPWLLSWYAPEGSGARGLDDHEIGSPELGRLARDLAIAGGVFAQPEGRAGLPASAEGARIVRRLGTTGSLGSDGSLRGPGVTWLTLTPSGLRHQP